MSDQTLQYIPSPSSAPSLNPRRIHDTNNNNLSTNRATTNRTRRFRRILACCTFCSACMNTMAFTTPLSHRVSKHIATGLSSPCTRRHANSYRGKYTLSSLASTSSSNQRHERSGTNDDHRICRDETDMYTQRSEILRANSKLSLAPMMEYTDRHFRHLVRLLSNKTLLYTEMVAGNAIAHERDDALSSLLASADGSVADQQSKDSLLDLIVNNNNHNNNHFDPTYLLRFLGQGRTPEGPSVLQLGGSDPYQMRRAARTVYEFHQLQSLPHSSSSHLHPPPIHCDYTAINLNCGCPSPKVAGKGCFGAALMEEPHLVRDIAAALHEGMEGTAPVTVKCRIGTDEGYSFRKETYSSLVGEEEEYRRLKRFVETVASGGVVTDFQIHARIAVLGKNFSPADNRKVPPLRYHQVRRLAREFPELNVSLNGGVETLLGVKRELDECPELEGVMVGRGWVSNPWGFCMADRVLYGDGGGDSSSSSSSSLLLPRPKHRLEVLEAYGRHVDYEEQMWDPVKIRRFMTKAISHLFAGEPNAKRYRVALDDIAGLPKKLMAKDPKLFEKQPPLSELIMDAALTHLSEEVLYRSPEESWEKLVWEEEEVERKKNVVSTVVLGGSGNNTQDESSDAGASEMRSTSKSLIQEWQISRKEEEKKYCGDN